MRTEQRLLEVLTECLGKLTASAVLQSRLARAAVDLDHLGPTDRVRLVDEFGKGLRTFLGDSPKIPPCLDQIRLILDGQAPDAAPAPVLGRKLIPIRSEADIVHARSAGRAMAVSMGFSSAWQVRIATSVSELARNIVHYAHDGEICIEPISGKGDGLEIIAHDNGPGIHNLDEILGGTYRSKSGMGMGLRGTRNLMDAFDVQTSPTGTTVTVKAFVK
jgi:serine/threonine-protein kinase RsbT